MKPNAKQQEAIEYLDGPLLVLAGPGTGKTQLLSEKVAYILQKTDTAPENILCLTYTDNATLNMRNRLTTIVGPDAHKVNIHTYHAFGVTVLQQYQEYNPEFSRSLDDAIDDVAQFKIINHIIEHLPPNDILRHRSTQITDLKDIVATIQDAKAACLSGTDLKAIAEFNLEQTMKINATLAPILARAYPRMPIDEAVNNVYQPALAELTKFTSAQPILGQIEREANIVAKDLHHAIDKALNSEKQSIQPMSKWRSKYFEKDEEGNDRLSNIVATKKLISLANIMDQYQEHLEKNGLYDYSDMIQMAIDFLEADPGFRLSLSERYQYILLDEFQDTNPSQLKIVQLLTDYEKPQVMAVGDDDQAICEFQGANSSNMLDFQNHYNAHRVALEDNYRSTQDILDLSRCVADQIEDSFAKKHNVEKKLQAKIFEGQISRHEFISSANEYAWVAQQIAELVEQGVPQSEIAVIAPKHKILLPLLPYFDNHKQVNIAYEKNDDIFHDERIAQLLKLAHFIYDLASEKNPSYRWLEILSFPFWQIPMTAALETIQSRHDGEHLKYFLKSPNEQIQKLAEFLSKLIQLSYETPLELFLDYLIGIVETPTGYKSPFLDFYASDKQALETFELYDHLSVLLSNVKKHTKTEQPKLTDLIHYHDDCLAADFALYSTSPYRTSDDSVQLMSVHKAKGLEFKYVFLISVDNQSWGKSAGNNNKFALPKNLIQIRHTGQTDDERLRLLFVATTRAKTHLIMTNAKSDFTGKRRIHLSYLNETETESPFLPENYQKIIMHEADDTTPAQNLRTEWISAYYQPRSDLRTALKTRVENYKLTATDLTTFIDIRYGGPLTFFERKIMRSPSEPKSKELSLGDVLHATFEHITKEHLTDEEAKKYLKKRAENEPISPADREWIIEKGIQSLTATLPKYGTLLRSENAVSELDFYHEHLQIDDIQITGKIDHLQINKQDKTITVYDFKTSKHHQPGPKAGWKADTALFKYALQLEFYKLLLKTSSLYRDYNVEAGHILFVNPDEQGQIADATYNFTDKSADEFLNLVKKVYHQITTLEFLDDPDLTISPDRERKKKEVFDFVKLLLTK